ncbi:MAG TPA: sulfite exporter TauE/SafE family protein [Methanomassiliicoccales archaeon]|nr:sulfite exporter TauE/SafE family protein [Methanomassiliicoccales archaeon]
MDPLTAIGIVAFSVIAGLVGALFGLGGGVIIIPALTLVFGVPMHLAIGASLIAVIASSTGSATHYVERGLSNIRLAMVLEVATTLGAVVGALIAVFLNQALLAAAFGIVLVYAAYYMIRRSEEACVCPPQPCGPLDLSCSYQDNADGKQVDYGVKSLSKGMAASAGAGGISGLLGVGGGIIKVPVMNLWMGVPMRAACATSNFMIGVTALAGAIVHYSYGDVMPVLAGIVAIGVFAGASLGTRISDKVCGPNLKKAFAVVLALVAVLMFLQAAGVV